MVMAIRSRFDLSSGAIFTAGRLPQRKPLSSTWPGVVSRAGGEEHVVLDDRAVGDDAADADQRARADRAVAERHVVADGGIFADGEAMAGPAADHGVVLNIGVPADRDLAAVGIEVAAEPDAGILRRDDAAAEPCRAGDEEGRPDIAFGKRRPGRPAASERLRISAARSATSPGTRSRTGRAGMPA